MVDVDVDHPDPGTLTGGAPTSPRRAGQHRLVAAELVAADVAGVALDLVGPRPPEPDPDQAGDRRRPSDATDEPTAEPRRRADGRPDGDRRRREPTPSSRRADATPDDRLQPTTRRTSRDERRRAGRAADAGPRGDPRPPVPSSTTRSCPRVSADDTDAGWGGRDEADDDERILRERPPHW